MLIPLPEMSGRLRALTGDPGPGYGHLHRMVISGLLPVITKNRRHYFDEEALPEVCKILGLTIPPANKVKEPRRAKAV